MAFVKIPPDPFPYEALKVYLIFNNAHVYYYDRRVWESPSQSHKEYLIEKARELLKKINPQWTKAEILKVDGNGEGETRLIDTLYP